MPIHDWTKIRAGAFHHFHQTWTIEIAAVLNGGDLPAGYFAMAEQIVGGPEPDVVTLQVPGSETDRTSGGIAIAETPPQAKIISVASENATYARKANTIAIREDGGKLVALIEVVSPGNKGSRDAFNSFLEKTVRFLNAGVHVLVVDLFPPGKRDKRGIHGAIWREITDEKFNPPKDKPLTAVAYSASSPITAYVEPLAVGDVLPSLPIFLSSSDYIPAPLETTYAAAWSRFPKYIKGPLEGTP
jgi:hypothetical protein